MGSLSLQVVRPSHVEDMMWDLVEEARRAGMDVYAFRDLCEESWCGVVQEESANVYRNASAAFRGGE